MGAGDAYERDKTVAGQQDQICSRSLQKRDGHRDSAHKRLGHRRSVMRFRRRMISRVPLENNSIIPHEEERLRRVGCEMIPQADFARLVRLSMTVLRTAISAFTGQILHDPGAAASTARSTSVIPSVGIPARRRPPMEKIDDR